MRMRLHKEDLQALETGHHMTAHMLRAVFSFLVGLTAIVAATPGQATTVPFTPAGSDYILDTTGSPVVVTGDPLGGLLTFNLTLNGDYSGPGVFGSFAMGVDTANNSGWSSATLFALGGGSGPTPIVPTDYSGGASLVLVGVLDSTTWATTILPNDSPIKLTIFSDLSGVFSDVPTFSYNFTSNTVSTTPLPAALPLFATGMGLMGWLGWRRRERARP